MKKCPKCGSQHVEGHGTNPGDWHWWLCRDCGENWDDEGEKNDDAD